MVAFAIAQLHPDNLPMVLQPLERSFQTPSAHASRPQGRQLCRRAGVYKQHDIVTAVYVLCEMDPALRQRTVAALWRRAGKALVLLEPGTPAGSATIRAARQQVRLGIRAPGNGLHLRQTG